MLELLHDLAIVLLAQQVSEFTQYVFILSRIKVGVVSLSLQILQLEEQIDELLVAWHLVDIDGEDGFQRFVALGELAHGSVMDGVPVQLVLLGQHLTVSLNDVL